MEVVEGVVSEVIPLLVGLPGNAGGLQPLGNLRPSVAGVPGVVGRIGYSSSLGAGRIRRQDRLGRIGRKWLVSGVSRDPIVPVGARRCRYGAVVGVAGRERVRQSVVKGNVDRKSVVAGKSVSGSVEIGGCGIIKK